MWCCGRRLTSFYFPSGIFFASPHCQPLCVIKDIVGVPGRGISVTKRSTTTPADMVLQPSFDQFLFLSISTTRRSTMATPEGHPYRSPQQGYRQGRLRRSWTCYCGLRSDDHLRRPRTQWCGLHSSDFYFPGGFFWPPRQHPFTAKPFLFEYGFGARREDNHVDLQDKEIENEACDSCILLMKFLTAPCPQDINTAVSDVHGEDAAAA